jgi:hypothetical protein
LELVDMPPLLAVEVGVAFVPVAVAPGLAVVPVG